MVLKPGHQGECITSTWTVVKCGAEEGWRSFGPIAWEILHTAKERNILETIKAKKGTLIGRILYRNCFLKYFSEWKIVGRMEVTVRRGRRRKHLPDDLKEKRRYWKLKEEAVGRNLRRSGFGRGYGFVVRRTADRTDEEWMIEWLIRQHDIQLTFCSQGRLRWTRNCDFSKCYMKQPRWCSKYSICKFSQSRGMHYDDPKLAGIRGVSQK